MTTGSTPKTKRYPCLVDVACPFTAERPVRNPWADRRPSPRDLAELRRT
ncbi:hypothetical protein ACFQU3_02175 [Terrabacter sp. GCM10028922]